MVSGIDWKNGFFRLWIAVSLLWIFFTGFLVLSTKPPDVNWDVLKKSKEKLLYIENEIERFDQESKTLTKEIEDKIETLEKQGMSNRDAWRALDEIEMKSTGSGLFDEPSPRFEQSRLLYEDRTRQLDQIENIKDFFIHATVLVFVPPIGCLAIGLLFYWVLSGFRRANTIA